MAAPGDSRALRSTPLRSLALSGVTRPLWDGRHPWGVVWCCSDLTPGPEALLGTHAGELLVLQGVSTLPSESVSADIAWATHEYPISHLFVLAHTGCQLLKHALRAEQEDALLGARVAHQGLHVDELSRSIALYGASALRRDLARVGSLPEVIVAFVDEHGRLSRVSGASAGQA